MPIARIPCINPGCGSDLVYDDVTLVNARTGKPAYIRPWALQAALLLASCLSLAVLQLVRTDTLRLALDVLIVVTFAACSLLTLALMTKPTVVARLVPTVRLHTYSCQICGYKWQIGSMEHMRRDR